MDIPKDDGLKWFGEGFDGFPKRLPDDCVEYILHIVNTKLDDLAIRGRLRKIQAAAITLTKKLLKDFIWQRDPFALELVRKDGTSFLRGLTNYGDSVEDEWLIVYLLRELSKQFEDAWIKVTDTDGEFLLIEAANTLPKWLNPEIADNRIWINSGSLLIIQTSTGPKSKSQALAGNLTLSSALNTISTSRPSLLNFPQIEEEAFYRLRNYPAQINANLHYALITIPRRLAFILHSNPAYISPIVEAFYLRDPIALKPLKASTTDSSALSFPPEDLVTARARFTKVGYAQLKSQELSAPGIWSCAIPPNAGSTARARAEMGMKVACGAEMLLGDPQNVDKKVIREIRLLIEDLEAGEENLPSDAEVKGWGMEEDDEDWLNIDFADLETELAGKKGGAGKGKGGEFGDKAAQENLRKMVERFEEFMNEDDLEDMDEDDDESESDSSEDVEDQGEDKDGSFDEDEFTAMMREMMGMPPEVMQEIMGPKAAKAKGVAREDGSINTKVLSAEEKPMFGPERPPHMQQPKDTKPSDVAESKSIQVDDDVEEIPRDLSSDEEDEEAQIKELSAAMEAELKRAGALSLEEPKDMSKKEGKKKITSIATNSEDGQEDADSEGELLDEDFNLVSNMLESFKAQGGLSGPGGNMLGMMGMKLPRDEGDEDEKGEGSSSGKSKR